MSNRWIGAEEPTYLIVNPHSRRGEEWFARARERLNARVRLVGAFLPRTPEAMDQCFRDGFAQGIVRFVVGGGDGTLSRAANRLVDTEGVLAILPIGTGNTFAWGIGTPRRLDEAIESVCEGPVSRYDVGEVTAGNETRVFLNTVSFGVSERLVELLDPDAKRRLGWLAWPMAVRRALALTPRVTVDLRFDQFRERFDSRLLVVANGRTLAGPIAATPDASAQDGNLDVFSLGPPGGWGMLCLSMRLLLGRHIHDRSAHYHRLDRVTVATTPSVPLDVDGDIWYTTPFGCRVRPEALAVMASTRRESRVGQTLSMVLSHRLEASSVHWGLGRRG